MRLNKASILSVCLLALRMGVAAAPTENINTALIVDEDHNTTSVADGHLPLANTGIEFPLPVAELEKRKARGSSRGTSRKPSKTTKKKTPKKKTPKKTPKKKTPKKKTPTKSKTPKPKITSKATLSPTKSKSVSKSASKTKSAKDPYGSCKPKKGAKGTKGTKGTKTKGKKGVKREEEGFTPISDEQYHSLAARDRKILQAGSIQLEFPTHPSSGDAITRKRYKADGMKAYGTRDPDPCDDDYNLKVVTYPSVQGQGLIGENWDTEHVMDAQIIQQFFDYLNENLPTSAMPATWWSRDSTGQLGHFQVQRASRFMRDFWEERRGTGGITATDYLLQVYPGTNQYTEELTLLGHGVNRKKESIFGHSSSGHCIGSSTWRNADYWGKVDKLRECVLLAKYMNHPDIQDSFDKVAGRISSRLKRMEQPGGFMESTDDYWARKKNDNKYLDRAGQVWEDQKLYRYWDQWLKQYMASRLSNLSSEITTKLSELNTIQKGAQRDRTLSQQRKDRIASRYRRIDRAWTATKPLRNPAP